jgi:hypothetical protein
VEEGAGGESKHTEARNVEKQADRQRYRGTTRGAGAEEYNMNQTCRNISL